MLSDKDPCGYYSALGVAPSATSDEIKNAFKCKAQQFHPDRNPAPEATRQFQSINEAYQVLGVPNSRADYDTQSYRPPEQSSSSASRNIEPVICSICHRTTAQPRYVIYRHVISAVLVTWRSVQQGVFCSECGAKLAYRASLKTWLAGWWGIPWGPIYSVHAIFSNMLGGEQRPIDNFRILSWQAVYFAHAGRLELAHAVAQDALAFASKIPVHQKSSNPEIDRIMVAMSALGADANTGNRVRTLRKVWGFGSRAFKVQLGGTAGFAVLLVGIAVLANISGSTSHKTVYKHVPPTEQVSPPAPSAPTVSEPSVALPAPSAPTFSEPSVELPATGRIRALWQHGAGTVLAPLKVITAPGSPNYYVKLVDWETHSPRLVFFVRSGQTVTVRIPIGVYELRYAAGQTWYGEVYRFGPETAYRKAEERFEFRIDDEKVSGFTVELIKQINGNLKEAAIKPSEF